MDPEQNNVQKTEEENSPPENVPQGVELTEIEQQAVEMGWRPKDEYTGDPDKWVNADIFVARAPLFEKIDQQSRETKELKRAIEDLKNHNKKIEEGAYKRALKELSAQRINALENGELAVAEQIRDQIDEIKDAQREAIAQPQQQSGPPPELVEWQNKNRWYNQDDVMTDWANGRAVKLSQQGLGPSEVLTKLSEEARTKFPDKFRNPNKDKASAVDSSKATAGVKKSNSSISLTPDEEKVMNRLVRTGVMTKDEYIKQITATRG